MGVDFYSCNKCGKVYADCGYFVTCEEGAGGCGRSWCSDECAKNDGYRECFCKLGKDLNDGEAYCEDGCEKYKDKYDSCSSVECEHFIEASCNHCRNEDFEIEDVVEYILKEYVDGKTINEIKEEMYLNSRKTLN